jgi:hypothetical protein
VKKDNLFTCYVQDRDQLRSLGNVLGSAFFDPLVSPQKAASHRVIASSYGITGSGKTLLFKSATEIFTQSGREIFSWKRKGSETKKINGHTFRYADLGDYTYTEGPGEIHAPGFLSRVYKGKTCREWLEESLPFVQAESDPDLTMVEHPSFPHLWDSDVIIVLGDPLHSLNTIWYFNGLNTVLKDKPRPGCAGEIQRQFEEQAACVLSLTKKLGRATIYEPRSVETGDERIVSFCFVGKDGPKRQAFYEFRAKAAGLEF